MKVENIYTHENKGDIIRINSDLLVELHKKYKELTNILSEMNIEIDSEKNGIQEFKTQRAIPEIYEYINNSLCSLNNWKGLNDDELYILREYIYLLIQILELLKKEILIKYSTHRKIIVKKKYKLNELIDEIIEVFRHIVCNTFDDLFA